MSGELTYFSTEDNGDVEYNGHGIPNGRVLSCYRLNLGMCVDPSTSFLDTDDDNRDYDVDISNSNIVSTPLQVAIQTASIFNGIFVGKDGVLLSQNERAGKKLLGEIVKEGQSRQAVEIERILNATNFAVINVRNDGKSEQELNASKPESQLLIVRGQFDDVSRLVLEGAEKLRKKKILC